MNKTMKRITAFLLLVVLVISTSLPTFAAGEPTTYSKDSNSGQRDVVCTTLNGTSAANYYKNYNYDDLSKQSANQLFNSLQTLMRSTHKNTSSYNDCHYKANKTDCENEDGSVSLIYTGYSATMSQWNGWNREHVWPQSLGGGNTSGGGADLHHIRPSDAGVNSSRGNKKYGESGSNATEKYGSNPAVGVLGGTYNSTYFEPLDNVKGDVARICLYVYVRWNSNWGASDITDVFQSVDVLLKWCQEDPVDTWEMGRNEVVGAIQGNRNVFIDYPEYAWLIFGEEVPTNMTTPSGKAASGSAGGGTTGCSHSSTEIRNAVSANCGKTGYTGDTYCKSCGAKVKTGTTISATGNHSWGAAVIVTQPTETSTGLAKYECTVCGSSTTTVIPKLEGTGDPVIPDAPSVPDNPVTPEVEKTPAEDIIISIVLGIVDSSLIGALS